ncbi:DUF4349 domain-containing protein [Nocardia sp. N13]|uniref:DUF4349 domain-containing protein n=1 Tax=Nocardioides sp. N13(2025) TaxID=3453405 RepID=UPI003F773D5A
MTSLRTTRTRAAGILTAITMTALLAACSANDSAGDATEASAGQSSDGGADSSGGSSSDAGGASSRQLGSSDATTSGSGTSAADPASTAPLQRSIIATGTVSLASKDVGETRRDVQRIVDAQGGTVTDESTETDQEGHTSYARLVVRVPSSKFGAAMTALEDVGVLRSSDRGSDDVTTEVIDNGARVRAQEASLKRVELLLAEAKTLKDVIWIESQLTSRHAELDSLKSQQAWLADQTSMSTITVDISTLTRQVVEEPDDDTPAGFMAGLRGGMKAVGAMLVAVATILGALLPFTVLVLVLGLPVWLVVRRRKAPPAAGTPTT